MNALRNPANQVLLGVLLMLGGDFMFSLNDAMGKWLVATLSVGQVLLVRSVGAFVILGPMIARQGARRLFDVERPWLQVARAVLTACETALFYAAVYYLPLADVFSFYMAGPIYVAALSHLMLGEKVGWRRWFAILIGFVGVLIMLKPSGDVSLASIYAVAGSVLFGVTIIFGRMLRGTSDTTLVTWQTICSLILGAGMVFMLGDWRTPTNLEWTGLLLLGIVSCLAHLMIVRALKFAPAATLAPLHYTMLLWGVIFGWVFFGDVPGIRIFVGSAVIVLAGLFIFHRQKVVSTVPPENVPKGVN
ncbi:MAG: DMT family transporter [Pseudomonadota bacterium]|nr:DMT family transporter [Pseudomonadota bacterium]